MSILAIPATESFSETPQNHHSNDQNILRRHEEILIYPEEYLIYQDYLKAIGGRPGQCDKGTVEATILSIKKTMICPDNVEFLISESDECSIEPYPKDLAIVRIDKIISYTPYDKQAFQPKIEESPQKITLKDDLADFRKASPENPSGSRMVQRKKYQVLQEGQEVETIFLLTTQPVLIRYAPINESKEGLESAITPQSSDQKAVGSKTRLLKKTFKPIPKVNNIPIFTTKIGKFPKGIEKKLPGLEVGSKFRATIRYNGQLYVEEYERRK